MKLNESTSPQAILKPLIVTAAAGLLSLSLVGCTSTPETAPASKPAVEEEVTKPGEGCAEGAAVSGDAILGTPEKNAAGEYCSIVVNPESPALKYDKTKTDAQLYELGYTDAELAQVQKDAVAFTIAQLVDNPTTGQSTDEVLEWITSEGPDYINKIITDAYVESRNANLIQGFDVTFTSGLLIPPLVYDGGARESQVEVVVDGIRPKTPPKDVTLADETTRENPEVMMTITTTYRVIPETYKEWRKDMLTSVGRGDSVHVVDEETSDFTKPLFYEHIKEINVSYDKQDVQTMLTDKKVRSITSNVETEVWFNAESRN